MVRVHVLDLGLFLVSLCPQRDTDTPPQPGPAGMACLGQLDQSPQPQSSWTFAPVCLSRGSPLLPPPLCSHPASTLACGLPQPSLTSAFSEPPPPGSPPGSSAGSAPGGSCPQGRSRPSCPQAEAGSVGPTGESPGERPCFPEPVPCLVPVVLAPLCGTPTHSLGTSQQAIWVAGSQGCELRLPLTWLLPPSGPWGVSASWRRSSLAHCQERCRDKHPGLLPGLLALGLPMHLVPEGLPRRGQVRGP